jgi:hypothetical protein
MVWLCDARKSWKTSATRQSINGRWSLYTMSKPEIVHIGGDFPYQIQPPMDKKIPNTCSNCLAWKPKPNQSHPIFGGCARSGKTTLHYGDVAYVHYTTDLQCCSAWEPK